MRHSVAPDGAERRVVKALLAGTTATESGEKVFTFLASNASVDRSNESIDPAGWDTANFERNPVFLVGHDYGSLPVGKVVALRAEPDGLYADVVFDQQDETARLVQSKFERGFLNAVSVGFRPLAFMLPTKAGDPLVYTRSELLELSAVAIPCNQDALLLRSLAALGGEDATPADRDAAASAIKSLVREALAELTTDTRTAAAALTAARVAAADAPSSTREGLRDAAAAAMVALLLPTGPDAAGTAETDEWRKRAYVHVERLYRHLELTPPEFVAGETLAALGTAEWKGLFWHGELDGARDKAGRVLSGANERRIRQALTLIQEVLAQLPDTAEENADGEAEQRGLSASAEPVVETETDAMSPALKAHLVETLKLLGLDPAVLEGPTTDAAAGDTDSEDELPDIDFSALEALEAFARR